MPDRRTPRRYGMEFTVGTYRHHYNDAPTYPYASRASSEAQAIVARFDVAVVIAVQFDIPMGAWRYYTDHGKGHYGAKPGSMLLSPNPLTDAQGKVFAEYRDRERRIIKQKYKLSEADLDAFCPVDAPCLWNEWSGAIEWAAIEKTPLTAAVLDDYARLAGLETFIRIFSGPGLQCLPAGYAVPVYPLEGQ